MKHTIIRFTRFVLTAGFILGGYCTLAASDFRITQVDSSRLLINGQVRLYLDVTGDNPDRIRVQESDDALTWRDAPVVRLNRGTAKSEGITFLLLLDNSGSMWDDLDGKPATDTRSLRITHARSAIRSFVSALSPADRAGLAVFNTSYVLASPISQDPQTLLDALSSVDRPGSGEGFTELYGSLEQAMEGFTGSGRRRVLIVLSDGEHYPREASVSPANTDAAALAAHREGISCSVIHFGTDKDTLVNSFALETGGQVFDARDSAELAAVYDAIRERVLAEYTVDYRALMLPGERRFVRVGDSVRFYFSGSLFGSLTGGFAPWLLFCALIPAGVWLFFVLFRLEKPVSEASVQLLYSVPGMSTRAFTLGGDRTVIGGDQTADITIGGNPAMQASAATILFDKDKNSWTLQAGQDLTVNNRPVKTKKLESGDVINVAGTVVVFDAPEDKGGS